MTSPSTSSHPNHKRSQSKVKNFLPEDQIQDFQMPFHVDASFVRCCCCKKEFLLLRFSIALSFFFFSNRTKSFFFVCCLRLKNPENKIGQQKKKQQHTNIHQVCENSLKTFKSSVIKKKKQQLKTFLGVIGLETLSNLSKLDPRVKLRNSFLRVGVSGDER
jgi:hypothetical protein